MSTESESALTSIPDADYTSLTTVVDWIRFTITQLQQEDVYFGHGTDNVWDEAEHLVYQCLHLPLELESAKKALIANSKVNEQEKQLLAQWVSQRTQEQMPLPYISNTAWFAGLPFYVDERVLIPRSPFGELIKRKFTPYLAPNASPLHILDMCTGSACIAIALANTFSEAMVDAVDIDSGALDVASINIAQYQLEERVYPLQSDVFNDLSGQQYDLIIANPPYVDAEDMADLPTEYHHEPELALASGFDGLDLTVKILAQAAQFLRDDGWLFVEVGNSEVNFEQRMNGLQVQWCELKEGGSGIFAISKAQLLAQQDILDELE